jgi:glyoxylase-like metal-dependent hydrolase (beta-lactamase superfamily II)
MTNDIEQQVDDLIDTRPGKELLAHIYDDHAVEVAPNIFRSAGSTAAYMIVHDAGRIIVNTGMGYEAVHHKRLFDAVCPGPTTHIITTQAHVDHVGGVGLFRDPDTVYIAQRNNPACQRDDARIQRLRFLTAQIWFDITGTVAKRIAAENPGVPMRQDVPTPDVMLDERHAFSVGGLDVELIASGGETVDSLIVWLPASRTALISNLLGPLFPHFPNLNTLRGDRYRFVEPWLETYDRLRALRPDRLITGRHLPIEGGDLIDAALRRLHGALDHVHRETLAGMNDGVDVFTLMRTVTLPTELRVGEGYGKVAWGVRTIWETYMGWFHQRSTTELYPEQPVEAMAELVDMLGAEAVCERAAALVADGRPVEAIHLAEAVLHRNHAHRGAAAVMVPAHQHLLDHGGDVSFWESGWLRHQRDRWAGVAKG